MYIHVCVYTCLCIYMCVYTCIYIYVCVYIYTHIYADTNFLFTKIDFLNISIHILSDHIIPPYEYILLLYMNIQFIF